MDESLRVCLFYGRLSEQLMMSIQVQTFKCLHLQYQSLENWTGARDILRCNPKFHGEEHYDCTLINMNSGRESFMFARLQVLLGPLPILIKVTVMTVTLPRYPIQTHFLFRSYFYYLNLSRYVLYSYSLVLVLIDRKYITQFCLPWSDFRLVLDVHTSFHFFLNTNHF
jgi:hypothetical protein